MSTNTASTTAPAVQVKVRDFCGKSKLFFILSAVLVVLSIASTFLGVKIALEFTGGTIITYSYVGDVDESAVSSAVSDLVGSEVTVQQGESLSDDSNTLSISFSSKEGLTVERQSQVTDALTELYPDGQLEVLDSNDVNATSGQEFFHKCIVAAAFAAVVLVLYIAFRFRRISGWSAGVCAVIGLLQTLIIVYGSVNLCRFEINSNFMAVILTLLGYAINDTIVVYDRIRENQKLMPKVPIEELINISSSQSLRRSLRTSFTTFFSMTAVTVVSLVMGVDSILSFSVPMMFGIVFGTYNSLCFVPSLWVWWQKKRGRDVMQAAKSKEKKKQEAEG